MDTEISSLFDDSDWLALSIWQRNEQCPSLRTFCLAPGKDLVRLRASGRNQALGLLRINFKIELLEDLEYTSKCLESHFKFLGAMEDDGNMHVISKGSEALL